MKAAAVDRSPGAAFAGSARGDLGELAGKAVIVSLFTLLAIRIGIDYLETGRLTGLLLLASETIVIVLTVARRAPVFVDRSLRARTLTLLSLSGPLVVRPSSELPLAAESITVAVSCVGLLIGIAGKLSLGRSFGLLPANRGVVCTGLYRVVRHPIYMSYLVSHLAFLAAYPSLWNLVALVTADLALMARAVCEEQALARDPEYRVYQGRVRWRVVPGVF